MESYEAMCGLERLPTKKSLRLSTVTVSSEGASQSSEVQDLASLTNSTCQAATVLAFASPASRSGAGMMAGKGDSAACSLGAACQIDVSSNLHAGEK